jgi:hypothetical protein
MPRLVLGPMLRYVSETEATIWVETDARCRVEALGHHGETFHVGGRHYALVVIEGLEGGAVVPYEVLLDGERAWPEPDSPFPPSVIRTLNPERGVTIAFGSCRVSAPQCPPYSLRKDHDPSGRELDALAALTARMRRHPPEDWPDVLLMLGDQVYADEVSPATRRFIRSRRRPDQPPGDEVADFQEYARLYHEAWSDPGIRWLLSTVSTSMIFDDHDIHDDWNTSWAWVESSRAHTWWDERIVSGLVAYWIYQHVGNLSPRELAEDVLWQEVEGAQDAEPALRAFAFLADRTTDGSRWSYCRDLGATRLVVIDSRAGRVLAEERRSMVDGDEWRWVTESLTGGFDHLLVASSLPVLLLPAMHDLEAWNEAVCGGAWGRRARGLGERIRQGLDLEHWAAFEISFRALMSRLGEVGAGRHGEPPASIVLLSGDVHHAYLAEAAYPDDVGVRSAVYQATCSPFRNPLDRKERAVVRAMATSPARALMRALARSAGVAPPGLRWSMDGLWFDNQVAMLHIEGRRSRMVLEKTTGDEPPGELEAVLDRRLAS